MKKEFVEKLKDEAKKLAILFVIATAITYALFNKESIAVVARTVFAFFWVFLIPGFALMYYWHEKIDFAERVVIGTVAGIALISIMSYWLALFGLYTNYHHIVLPIICLIISFLIISKKIKE